MTDIPRPSLGVLLFDAARLLRRRFDQESRDLPMTSAQLRVIALLRYNEGIGQAALAALLDLEPMTLCRHIDRMEAAGLVERRPDPDDRRARRIFTTAQGRALFEPMRARAEAVYARAEAGLSSERRAALRSTLQAIIANLSDAEAPAATPPPDEDQTRGDRA